MRRHPVTLRHALLAAARTYNPDVLDGEQQITAVNTLVTLIMEMFDVGWTEDTYQAITEVIEGKISLEAGIAVVNAAVRRQEELTANDNTT